MRYISTRGKAPALNFEDVLLAGLASDGGLYVPENLPRFTQEEIASWAGLPYHELAFRVMRPFVTGSIADADFKKILEETRQPGGRTAERAPRRPGHLDGPPAAGLRGRMGQRR